MPRESARMWQMQSRILVRAEFVPAGSGIGASRLSLLTDPRVTKYGPTPVRATRPLRIFFGASKKFMEGWPTIQDLSKQHIFKSSAA
jgi:hypothetical protein